MITNRPIIWTDAPDNDVIRVGDAFYMISTSMHSMPGGPIMKSFDLEHWTVVSYLYDILEDAPENRLETERGIYGQGSWAASLRYVDGYFYCLFNCNDKHHAYMFRTDDPEKSGWEKYPLDAYMHDPALLIDGERRYVLYGNGDIWIAELEKDMLSLKKDVEPRILFESEKENIGLRAEGTHAYKFGDTYYAIMIDWPRVDHCRRREICYRWKSFDGPFEHRTIFDDDLGYHNAGIAQGAIFTLPDGYVFKNGEMDKSDDPASQTWAAMLFQDHGAVGRIPFILPVEWEDGWPMVKTWPEEKTGASAPVEVVGSDDFVRNPGEERALADAGHFWQWNHNPDDELWSLSDRKGWLRLKNGHITNRVLNARNTLTQRTCGPTSVYSTHVDFSGIRPGDRCGLVAVQGQFGSVGIRKSADGRITLVQCSNCEGEIRKPNYDEKVIEEISLENCSDIYLRISFDFVDNNDKAVFTWSRDGREWKRIGEERQLRFSLDHFMGCRVGLYSYCTEETGGYADFEYFDVSVGE